MKILHIHPFSDWHGTSKTQTTWPQWPWMLAKLSFLTFEYPAPQLLDLTTIGHVLMGLLGRRTALAIFVQLVSSVIYFAITISCLLVYIIMMYCFIGDDHQALIWDIQQMPRAIEDPILAYTAAEGEINQIQWGATQPDWIAICYNKNLEILRV